MEEYHQYLKYVSIIGPVIVFLIGLFKWIDQRNREIENRLYQAFHQTICRASGKDEEGRIITMLQQVASIYQLQRFKQYSFAAIPVLELMKFENTKNQEFNTDDRNKYLIKAIDETINHLKN
ncbi:hypothetical protein KFE94_13105 [bacterium SCSIO 12643]|nr:hypothetical protein KFE94_13105 [bacterium SCSIO 12643]